MRKIPTVFERDWDGDRSRVLDRPVEGCEWVFAGEGVATRKLDGTSCLVEGGRLYKRFALPEGRLIPDGFVEVEWEGEEGKRKLIGWLPVGDGPEDAWHREALAHRGEHPEGTGLPAGTYELLGPKVQGNPEGFDSHVLVAHADAERLDDGIVLTFDGIREFLTAYDFEGIVWHHPDGRMAKIKGRDFGVRRGR